MLHCRAEPVASGFLSLLCHMLLACGEIAGRLWACISLGCSNTNSAGSFYTWHRCLQLTQLGGMQPLCCQATLPISLGNF